MILAILLVETQTIKVELSKQSNGFDFGEASPWLVALAALGFSVYQYYTNTRVKRLEYLNGLAKEMRKDPLIGLATQMLDWEVRTFKFEGKTHVYSWLMLDRALADHGTDRILKGGGFNETEVLIRDAFDALFDFTENMQYAVRLKVITRGDIYKTPLAYYLGRLCENDTWTMNPHVGEEARSVSRDGAILKYLKRYGFTRTEQLLRRCRQRCAPKILAPGADKIESIKKLLAASEDQAKQKETPTTKFTFRGGMSERIRFVRGMLDFLRKICQMSNRLGRTSGS